MENYLRQEEEPLNISLDEEEGEIAPDWDKDDMIQDDITGEEEELCDRADVECDAHTFSSLVCDLPNAILQYRQEQGLELDVCNNSPDKCSLTSGSSPETQSPSFDRAFEKVGSLALESRSEREIANQTLQLAKKGKLGWINQRYLQDINLYQLQNIQLQDLPVIGKGSFGKVYRVVTSSFPGGLAVKEVSLRKFCPEEVIVGGLLMLKQQNQIIAVIAAWVSNQTLRVRLYTPLVEGAITLKKIMKRVEKTRSGFSQEFFYSFILDCFTAALYIHDKCVSHGDIHGGNILIRGDINYCRAYLIDFGNAKIIPEFYNQNAHYKDICDICQEGRFVNRLTVFKEKQQEENKNLLRDIQDNERALKASDFIYEINSSLQRTNIEMEEALPREAPKETCFPGRIGQDFQPEDLQELPELDET